MFWRKPERQRVETSGGGVPQGPDWTSSNGGTEASLALALRGAWAPIAVFLAHVFASRGLNAYAWYPPLDIPMHFAGGVAIAHFFAVGLAALPEGAVAGRFRPLFEGVATFALTCTAAVFWEFAEFLSDRYFGTRAQGGLEDTLLDMALGAAGGLTYALTASWSRSRSSLPP